MLTDTSSPLEWLIWAGAAISLVGLAGLVWCIVKVARARRARLPDEEMRAVLKAAVPLNLGALFLSVIGLMLVILGIFFS
jgi:Flp pilus assembly protein CpaB